MMKRLSREERNALREHKYYGSNPLFKALLAACLQYKSETGAYELNPEEVFGQVVRRIDDIACNKEKAAYLVGHLWDSQLDDMETAKGYSGSTDDAKKPTAVVLTVLLVCMDKLKLASRSDGLFLLMEGLIDILHLLLSEKYPGWIQIYGSITDDNTFRKYSGDVSKWLYDYWCSTDVLTDAEGNLLMDITRETRGRKKPPIFKNQKGERDEDEYEKWAGIVKGFFKDGGMPRSVNSSRDNFCLQSIVVFRRIWMDMGLADGNASWSVYVDFLLDDCGIETSVSNRTKITETLRNNRVSYKLDVEARIKSYLRQTPNMDI